MLLEEAPIESAIVATEGGFDLLPGSLDLTAAELKLMDALARESRLKEQLAKLGDRYHTILIDCPPTLHLLTINALTAAHGVLIPVQCEYFALEGLSSLLDTIKAVRQRSIRGSKSKACCARCMTCATISATKCPRS